MPRFTQFLCARLQMLEFQEVLFQIVIMPSIDEDRRDWGLRTELWMSLRNERESSGLTRN